MAIIVRVFDSEAELLTAYPTATYSAINAAHSESTITEATIRAHKMQPGQYRYAKIEQAYVTEKKKIHVMRIDYNPEYAGEYSYVEEARRKLRETLNISDKDILFKDIKYVGVHVDLDEALVYSQSLVHRGIEYTSMEDLIRDEAEKRPFANVIICQVYCQINTAPTFDYAEVTLTHWEKIYQPVSDQWVLYGMS